MPSRDERRTALRKRESIQVYVTLEDKRRIEDAALAKGRRSSEFLRELALAEADRFEKKGRRRGGTQVSYEEKAPNRGPAVTGQCLAGLLRLMNEDTTQRQNPIYKDTDSNPR